MGAARGHRRGAAAHPRLVQGEAPLVRVLVTGGAGFIGSHVVDRLLADGHRVDVVDNLSTGRREFVNAKATSHGCDIRSTRLDEVFAAAEPEAVVHVAAQAAVARSTADPLTDASVIAISAHRLLSGQPCVVHWDGEQSRDYVYVEDVADAVSRALDRPEVRGIVNIGTGVEVSVNELYRRLAALAGVTQPPEHGPRREGDWRRGALDATRAAKTLGWTPLTTLEAGLAHTMAYFKAGQTVSA